MLVYNKSAKGRINPKNLPAVSCSNTIRLVPSFPQPAHTNECDKNPDTAAIALKSSGTGFVHYSSAKVEKYTLLSVQTTPPPPPKHVHTYQQHRILRALQESVIPAFTVSSKTDPDATETTTLLPLPP